MPNEPTSESSPSEVSPSKSSDSESTLRPFRTRRVREVVLAPELDRYLGRRNVDLLLTDQIEALQVRVRAGLDVLERRRRAAEVAVGGRLRSVLLGVAGGTAFAVIGFCIPEDLGTQLLAMLPGALVALTAGILAVPLARDRSQLRRLRGRYDRGIAAATSSESLLEFSESVLREARALGMVPAFD